MTGSASILDAALDCAISMDQHGRVTYFNAAAERTFGYSADVALGKQMVDLIVPPQLRDQHRAGFDRHLSTGQTAILDRRIEITAVRSDGSEFPVELTITRTGSDEAPEFTGFVRDISARVRTEQDLRAARRRVIEAADAARANITRDLHDGAQQQFVNTVLNLKLAQEKWERAPERAQELVALAIAEAEAGIDGLRELVAGIHPTILTNRGLAAALEALAARLPWQIELDVVRERFAERIEGSLYFFCSEALTNVAKHAAADSVRVFVGDSDEQLTIEIQDDGVGGAAPGADGSGLSGLYDRIAALDGTLTVDSPPERGTRLRAVVPLPYRLR
jgi:PAS domain S-box-containing protein